MRRLLRLLAVVATVVIVFACATSALAQDEVSETGSEAAAVPHIKAKPGVLVIPQSSLPQIPAPGQKLAAHTNVQLFIPGGWTPILSPPSGYAYETPASLACVYGLVATSSGCNPLVTTTNATGGSETIAIVDAYDDPQAYGDLAWFSDQFGIGLKASQFSVIWANTSTSSCYSSGVPIDPTGGWELEESLDIEYAHAMAPGATIYLVEACSNYFSDLFLAVNVASNLVRCGQTTTCPAGSTGKGEVSMSWGGGEFSSETSYDSYFTAANVVYVASTGDAPGTIYPSVSPNVVAAGGLTHRRSITTGNLIGLTGWVSGGGGKSFYEARPSYQSSISSIVGTSRGVPDVSFDADPNTGVWVYDTFPVEFVQYYNWIIVGGTSLAAPALAGVINRAGAFAANSNAELTQIYANQAVTTDFTDIRSAYCGYYMSLSAGTGWDYCSGVGAVKGYAGK